MITDAEQHHKVGACRARKAKPCLDCGLLKLEGVEHKCSVKLALQQEGALFHLIMARGKIEKPGVRKRELDDRDDLAEEKDLITQQDIS